MSNKLDKIPERIEQIHDSNPNPILKVDSSGLIIYANAASKTLLDSFKSSVGNYLSEKWVKVIKDIYSTNLNKEVQITAGPLTYLVHFVPSLIEHHIYVYGTNITAYIENRKKTEEALSDQEELYKSVLTSIGEGILIANKDGIINFVNEQIEQISGYLKGEMLGKTVFELFFPENQMQKIKNKLNQGIDNQYKIEVLTKDRRKIFVDIKARPFRNALGEIKGSILAISDITENMDIAKRIKIQETLLNNILNNLPVNIYLKNEEGKIIFINDTAAKTLNKSKSEILNKDAYMLFPEETAHNIKEDDRQVRENNVPKIIEDNSLFGKYYLRGKIPFHIDNMGPLLLGYSIDISERKKAEEEAIQAKQKAEESIKSKERFISIMSHEIRTPMNAVVGITNLLLKKEHNPDQKELLKGLKISSENLLKILNNILDLSKIDSGKLVLESADMNLREILESVREASSYKAAEKNIFIDIEIDKQIPSFIKGDSFRLNQILLNLLSNAVKFTEEGRIEILVKMLDDSKENYRLLFTISDTGIGIAKEKLSDIFESFTQASSDISKKYGGTGLGLTITKKLIEFQNGTIGVESIKNKGSKFIFDLSFGKSNKTVDEKLETDLEYNFEGLQALVVEDNEMNQLVIVRFLEQQKILTSVACNGKEALKLLKTNNYDFILMDLQMPELDGYETSVYIREKLKNNKIPIIALTASASDDIETKVLKAGMNDYITKPFEPSNLFSIIAHHTAINKNKNANSDKMKKLINIPGTEKVTDLTYLQEASAGNKKFIAEMINIFLEQTPGFINHLTETSKRNEWAEFRKTMHKIKPTIIMMGIHLLEADIPIIETSVKKETNLQNVSGLVAKMEKICAMAYEELKIELTKL